MKALLLFFSLLGAGATANAGEPATDFQFGVEIPLSAAEISQMQIQLVENHPFLASSPGVKHASAQLSMRAPTDQPNILKQALRAYVYFYPYSESHGIKHGALATCWRWTDEPYWDCDHLQSRDYVALENQEFEVRVSQGISFAMVKALHSLTRDTLRNSYQEDQALPAALISISHSYGNVFLIGWGAATGHPTETVKAELLDSSHPTDAASWRAAILKPGDSI